MHRHEEAQQQVRRPKKSPILPWLTVGYGLVLDVVGNVPGLVGQPLGGWISLFSGKNGGTMKKELLSGLIPKMRNG